jgi:hypothetical protein
MPDMLSAEAIGLRPVMTLTSEIIGVQDIVAGERVGYGGTFEASAPTGSAWWPAAMPTAIRVTRPPVRPSWWTGGVPVFSAACRWTCWLRSHPSAGRRHRLGGHPGAKACRRRSRQRGRHHQLRAVLRPAARVPVDVRGERRPDGESQDGARSTECGGKSPRWQGQCPHCHAWNTLVESVVEPELPVSKRFNALAGDTAASKPWPTSSPANRAVPTGIEEFDRVLGGGLVPGGVVLIGGDPGIGKSTLLLQALALLSGRLKALYVSGEESAEQVALRAARLQLDAQACSCCPKSISNAFSARCASCAPTLR